jgi:hypothetical protein
MKCTLEFYFNDGHMNQLFRRGIIIEDAPFVPRYGDTIDFMTGDYLSDPEQIEQFSNYRGNTCLFAEPLNTIYGKDRMFVQILVLDEKSFKQAHELPKFHHMLENMIEDYELVYKRIEKAETFREAHAKINS